MDDKIIMDDKIMVIHIHSVMSKEEIRKIVNEIIEEKTKETMRGGFELIME